MESIFLLLGAAFAVALGGFGGGGSGGGGSSSQNNAPDPTQEGDDDPNALTGTNFDDVIFGREGDDTIDGGIGNDYLDGNADNDELIGGIGDDTLRGGLGDDSLSGGSGQDSLLGFGGVDTLEGGEGDDYLRGGGDNDIVTGGLGNDTVIGGEDDDTVSGILGEPGDFPTSDLDGADTLQGWGGSDTIILGNGDQGYGEFQMGVADGAGDTFVVGSWITTAAATVHDFDPLVDRIEYYQAGSETLTMTSTDVMGDITFELRADGDVVLEIPVGTSGDVITLANVTIVT